MRLVGKVECVFPEFGWETQSYLHDIVQRQSVLMYGTRRTFPFQYIGGASGVVVAVDLLQGEFDGRGGTVALAWFV